MAVTKSRTPSEFLKQLAFTVLHDVHALGEELNSVNMDDLATRIRRIHEGVNPQNEFQANVAWLGQAIAFALQDAGDRELRAPDFLLVSTVDGRQLPVLVEVKSTDDGELVWTAAYLTSLRRFADLLHLPLLVAWKRHGLWALTDTQHFCLRNVSYHLSFEDAMKENLMFVLCGDIVIELDEHFQFIITGEVTEPLPPKEELAPAGTYTIKLKDLGFFNKDGRITELQDECFWLFNCTQEENFIERPEQQIMRAIHHPITGSAFHLSRVLLAQLAWNKQEDDIDWNAELRRRPFPSNGNDYMGSVQRLIDIGVVRYGMKQVPHTTPHFLRAPHATSSLG